MATETVAKGQGWPRVGLMLFFIMVLVLRQAVVKRLEEGLYLKDPGSYRHVGTVLAHSGTYATSPYAPLRFRNFGKTTSTALRAPLYTLLVAASELYPAEERNVLGPGGASVVLGVLQITLGAATVLFVLQIGLRWGLSRRGATVAAGLVAVDPLLCKLSAEVLPDTLAAFLAVIALWALSPSASPLKIPRVAIAGAVLALCVLCCPTFLLWLLVVGVSLITINAPWRRRVITGAVFTLSAAIVLVPWVTRNYFVFGRPIITTTGGGIALLFENFPRRYLFMRENDPWSWIRDYISNWDFCSLSDIREVPGSTEEELDRDQFNYREAAQSIAHDPKMFLVSSVLRFARLWSICPSEQFNETISQRLGRYAIAVFYLAEFALAIWGSWLLGRRWLRTPWLWGLLLVVSSIVTSTFLWWEMALRSPFVSVIALAAGAGVAGRRWWSDQQVITAQ